MAERKDYRIHNINQEFAERRGIPELPSRGVSPIDITDSEIAAASKVLADATPCFDMGNTPHWAKPANEGKNPFQKAEDKLKDKDDDGDKDDDDDKSDDKDDDDDDKDDGKKKKAKVVVKVEEGREIKSKISVPKKGKEDKVFDKPKNKLKKLKESILKYLKD